mgnify:CR=1 FL=1
MIQVYVKYNPYRLKTEIQVNGKDLTQDSGVYKLLKGKRLQEWVSSFPKMLVDEFHSVDFDVEFYGMPLDWDDFEEAMKTAKQSGMIQNLHLKFIEGRDSEDITNKIVSIFNDLKEGPVDAFRDPKLLRAFEDIRNAVFPINVIATMSSGKSTLINALLQQKLMPSKNEACTATITEILDTDEEKYSAVVFDTDGGRITSIDELTYEVMDQLNANEKVGRIEAEGNIPFLDSDSTALCLVDTPGPNNAQNQQHKNTTYSAVNSDSNNLILYVLNATQLGTNDDDNLLKYVAEQIQKGGKQARDRFLFVINKMDTFDPSSEKIEDTVKRVREYLAKHGIEEPQIYPCSASVALNIRTVLRDVDDVEKLTRAEERALPMAARETLPLIDKFNEYPSLHLEQYSTLSPSAQQELNFRLRQAESRKDTKEQALIHCGIYSIEAAITAYVKKYAKTKKVKDLVESFQEVLESSKIFVDLKTRVASDEKAAQEIAHRAEIVRKKIENGKEAQKFKDWVEKLDPVPAIEKKTQSLKDEIDKKIVEIMDYYGTEITSRQEAERFVYKFEKNVSNSVAQLSADMGEIVNREVIRASETLLKEYQDKLQEIDKSSGKMELDFSTMDLVKGALSNMRERVTAQFTDQYTGKTIDEHEKKTTETYFVKVGEKEVKRMSGTHQEKIGTKKVLVGTHQEEDGTEKVKNRDRKFFQFWKPKYIDVKKYKTVEDYKDEDVYQTVTDFETVKEDILEKKEIEKYSIKVSDLYCTLFYDFDTFLHEGINEYMEAVKAQVIKLKEYFKEEFDKLDRDIKSKYEELTQTTKDQKKKEEELKQNRKVLEWLEVCQTEINEALNI